jgi:hypothetical protein
MGNRPPEARPGTRFAAVSIRLNSISGKKKPSDA